MPRKPAGGQTSAKSAAVGGEDLTALCQEFRLEWGTWPDWSVYGSAPTQLVIRCDVIVNDTDGKEHYFWSERVWTPNSASVLTIMLQTGHMVYHEVDRMFARMSESKQTVF